MKGLRIQKLPDRAKISIHLAKMKLLLTCTLKSPQIRHHDYIKNLSPNNWAKILVHLLLVGLKLHGIAKSINMV